MSFLRIMITAFIGNVHETPHVEVNSDVFYFIFLHILNNKINIITYFNVESVKNTCFMEYLDTQRKIKCYLH